MKIYFLRHKKALRQIFLFNFHPKGIKWGGENHRTSCCNLRPLLDKTVPGYEIPEYKIPGYEIPEYESIKNI